MMLMMAWNHGDGNGRHSSLAAPASELLLCSGAFQRLTSVSNQIRPPSLSSKPVRRGWGGAGGGLYINIEGLFIVYAGVIETVNQGN